ncbi:hypothetical protein JR316_0009186 [Psilocybe cubensis]|uniref:BHLH domain-containing protein n=2 Tax=Psilocybe cubensis TaxID=181762 RepID=A0A8H7XWI3_PSICU|nr:hypothetical protein JR316_0009186 [Psilocybe cubensis]KAH9478726.1 hypothetical protein JR316_0009186 [Psilocybe cubensis]
MDPSILPTDYSSYASSSSSSNMATSHSNTPTTSGNPQSPNALAMNLLQNLMQIQGLENNIVQQQLSSSIIPGAGSGPNTTQVPQTFTNNSALLLEQQIKLSQLQQLQQLQNQIFQQQIALISGQSPSMLPSSPHVDPSRQSAGGSDQYTGLPTPGPSAEIRPQRPSMSMDFATLSPSGSVTNYIEPLPRAQIPLPASAASSSNSNSNNINEHSQHQLSPNPNMIQSQHFNPHHSSPSHVRHGSLEGTNLNPNLQRQLQALSSLHHQATQRPHHPLRQGRTPNSASPSFDFQHDQDGMSSPIYPPTSPIHHPTSPHHEQAHRNPNYEHHSQNHNARHHHHHHLVAPHSAPERVAFQIFQGPFPGGGGGIPGLTLGPAGIPVDDGQGQGRRMSLTESPRYTQGQGPAISHINQMQILDQDISPLTSPWLGAHPTGSANANQSNASPNASSGPSSRSRNAHRTSASASMGVTSSSSSAGKAGGAGSKRTASSSGDEGGGGSGRSRKKQSPAIRPTLGLSMSAVVSPGERERGSISPFGGAKSAGGDVGNDGEKEEGKAVDKRKEGVDKEHMLSSSSSSSARSGSVSGSVSPAPDLSTPLESTANSASGPLAGSSAPNAKANTRRPYRGSLSTNSTPLMRGTPSLVMTPASAANSRAKEKSRSKSRGRSGLSAGGAGAGGVQDTPSPVDLNNNEDDSAPGGSGGRVDRSMPPPPLPASVARGNGGGGGGMELDMGVELGMGVDGMMGMNRMRNDQGGESLGMHFGEMMNSHVENHEHDLGRMDGIGMMGMGMGISGMDMNMNNLGGMEGMGMGMGLSGMGGMDMDMDMGMGIGSFGGMDMMDMGNGVEFGSHGSSQQQQSREQNQNQGSNQQMQPPPPSSQNQSQRSQQQQQQPLVPVTPASIMNLGRLGINNAAGGSGRLGSASASATVASASNSGSNAGALGSATMGKQTKTGKKEGAASAAGKVTSGAASASATVTTRSGRVSTRRAGMGNMVSPSLKPLLPAGSMTPNMDPTLPSPMTVSAPNTPRTLPVVTGGMGAPSFAGGPPMHVRKTSHKAAEQKRRDSLKTTFDDLRKLLPPIALPTDAEAGGEAMLTSPLFNPTTPLLPGALPPRGPPKAGGEGPNKGVSKLQLLICGNEYIRLLKGRVERRDDEIGKLRREIGRLRMVVEEKGGEGVVESGEGEGEEALDLEKDLDAVEKNAIAGGSQAKNGPTNDAVGGDDAMDEGDDEGDD